jgi:hypothetical protein
MSNTSKNTQNPAQNGKDLMQNNAKSGQNGMVRYLSTLMNRAMLAWRAGTRFEGKRDYYQTFGYETELEFRHFLSKYVREGIAKRVINAYSSSTWTDGVALDGGEAFNTAWKKVVEDHNVWAVLQRLDRLSSLGRYAVLLVGFDDGAAMDQPVAPGARNVIYMQPYSELSAVVESFVKDAKDPRFGLPEIYQINLMDPAQEAALMGGRQRAVPISVTPRDLPGQVNGPTSGTTIRVHYSRIVHVAEDLLENNVYGIPKLEPIYNYLDDLLKVTGGSAENYWMSANRGVQVDVDKEMELSPEDAKELTAEVEEWQHELRRFVRTRGVKMTPLKGDFSAGDATFRMLISLIAGTTGIPQRVLLGAEVGQLASEQDRANWANRVDERRKEFAYPYVVKPLVQMLINAGVIPAPSGTITAEWPRAFKMSPLERAQESAQFARSIVNASKQVDSGFPIASLEEVRTALGLPETVKGTLPQVQPAQHAGGQAESNRRGTEPLDDNNDAADITDEGARSNPQSE